MESRSEGEEARGKEVKESITKAEARHDEGQNTNTGTGHGQNDLFRCLVPK